MTDDDNGRRSRLLAALPRATAAPTPAAAVGGSYQVRLAEHTREDQCVLSQPSGFDVSHP